MKARAKEESRYTTSTSIKYKSSEKSVQAPLLLHFSCAQNRDMSDPRVWVSKREVCVVRTGYLQRGSLARRCQSRRYVEIRGRGMEHGMDGGYVPVVTGD